MQTAPVDMIDAAKGTPATETNHAIVDDRSEIKNQKSIYHFFVQVIILKEREFVYYFWKPFRTKNRAP